MAKEWTDDEVAAEISKAVQIVREDRIDTLIRSRLSAPPNPNPGTENKPPPSSGNPDTDPSGNPAPKRKSLWWGEQELSAKASEAHYGKRIIMPMGDRSRREKRRIRVGDIFTIDEEKTGELEFDMPEPDPDPPPIEIQGEPWGWTKGPPYPRGWREDGKYDPESRMDAD